MLLLTWLSITNQSSSFYFRIVYLHINFGICFSTCQLDCLFVIANKSRYPIRDWSFVSQLLLTVFLFSNPCRTIQINCFQLIFNLPTAFESFRLISLPIFIPTCVINMFQTRQCWYCYPLNEFFIPRLYCYSIWGFLNCYCLHNNISFVSFFRSSDW
jgi:hypothetical protein